MQCILHRETILLHGSFTLLLVFIPPSISKTWLKCSSYQHLCWTTKKRQWDGKKNEAEKSKASFTAWRFSSFTGGEKKRTQTFKLFSLPLSPSVSLSHSPQQLKTPLIPEDNPTCIKSSIASPEQHFSHTYFLSQSIDIIPRALFSPITLFHGAIGAIGAVPWLGLREERQGLLACCRPPIAVWW